MLALLVLQGAAICQGWQPTPEARMACCEVGIQCTMHESMTDEAVPAPSQADADRCCAESESDDSSAPSPNFALKVSPAVPMSAVVFLVAPVASTLHPRDSLPPPSHVAKHVLLSVFLV